MDTNNESKINYLKCKISRKRVMLRFRLYMGKRELNKVLHEDTTTNDGNCNLYSTCSTLFFCVPPTPTTHDLYPLPKTLDYTRKCISNHGKKIKRYGSIFSFSLFFFHNFFTIPLIKSILFSHQLEREIS